jgi:FkbM family methyltransferase
VIKNLYIISIFRNNDRPLGIRGTASPKLIANIMTLKSFVKSILSKKMLKRINPLWRHYKEFVFSRQSSKKIHIGKFVLDAPASHPITELYSSSNYRDLCVEVTAKYCGAKYPNKSIIDIGANIGDTATRMRLVCANHLVLVEASDTFFEYLKNNSQQLGNSTLLKAFVADGSMQRGTLRHWGGTAHFVEDDTSNQLQTCELKELTDKPVCFIKSDTDGFDHSILLHGIEWLRIQHPVILLEDQVNTASELVAAEKLFEQLVKSGYNNFIFWDDAGSIILSTNSLAIISDMHKYLLLVHTQKTRRTISNYDVGCFHQCDEDIFLSIKSAFE